MDGRYITKNDEMDSTEESSSEHIGRHQPVTTDVYWKKCTIALKHTHRCHDYAALKKGLVNDSNDLVVVTAGRPSLWNSRCHQCLAHRSCRRTIVLGWCMPRRLKPHFYRSLSLYIYIYIYIPLHMIACRPMVVILNSIDIMIKRKTHCWDAFSCVDQRDGDSHSNHNLGIVL